MQNPEHQTWGECGAHRVAVEAEHLSGLRVRVNVPLDVAEVGLRDRHPVGQFQAIVLLRLVLLGLVLVFLSLVLDHVLQGAGSSEAHLVATLLRRCRRLGLTRGLGLSLGLVGVRVRVRVRARIRVRARARVRAE